MIDKLNLYIIDTSSLIQIKDHYDRRILPGIWKDFEHLIIDQRLIAPEEVRKEILEGDDSLVPWVQRYARMFYPNGDLIGLTQNVVLKQFPRMAKEDSEKPNADPFVVALAIMMNQGPQQSLISYNPIVVSDERSDLIINPKLPSYQIKKIPDVCNHFRLRCINHLEMFKAERFWFH
jgi:hypothetical protein